MYVRSKFTNEKKGTGTGTSKYLKVQLFFEFLWPCTRPAGTGSGSGSGTGLPIDPI